MSKYMQLLGKIVLLLLIFFNIFCWFCNNELMDYVENFNLLGQHILKLRKIDLFGQYFAV